MAINFLRDAQGNIIRDIERFAPGSTLALQHGATQIESNRGFEVDAQGFLTGRKFSIPGGTQGPGRTPIGGFQSASGGQGIGTVGPGQQALFQSAQAGGRPTPIGGFEAAGGFLDPLSMEFGAQSFGPGQAPGGRTGAEKIFFQRISTGIRGAQGRTQILTREGFPQISIPFLGDEPRPSPGEDPRDFQVRLARFHRDEARLAFMSGQETSKASARALRLGKAVSELKTRQEFMKQAEEGEQEFNRGFDEAMTQFTSDRNSMRDEDVRRRTDRITMAGGSKAAREAIEDSINKTEDRAAKQDVERERKRLARVRDRARRAFVRKAMLEQQKMFERAQKPETLAQLKQDEKLAGIRQIQAEGLARGEKITLAKGEHIWNKRQKIGSEKEQIMEILDELRFNGDIEKGQELSTAFQYFGGDMDKAETWAEDFMPPGALEKQKEEIWTAQGYSAEEIQSKRKEMNIKKDVTRFFDVGPEEQAEILERVNELRFTDPVLAGKFDFFVETGGQATAAEIFANTRRLKAQAGVKEPKAPDFAQLALAQEFLKNNPDISLEDLSEGLIDLPKGKAGTLVIEARVRQLQSQGATIEEVAEDAGVSEDDTSTFFQRVKDFFFGGGEEEAATEEIDVAGKTVDDYTEQEFAALPGDVQDVIIENSR